MTEIQTYARQSNARNAAVAQLGKDAVEGTHYELKRLEDGRFTYHPLKPENSPTGAEQGVGKPPTRRRGTRATTGRDRAEKKPLFRPGSKMAKAMALYMRPEGATTAQIREACGGPQMNVLRQVTEHGHKVERSQVEGPQGRQVTVYRVIAS